jgi:hypothetical protein
MNDNNISSKKPLNRKIYLLIHRFMFAISRKHSRNDIQIAMFPLDKDYPAAFSKMIKLSILYLNLTPCVIIKSNAM